MIRRRVTAAILAIAVTVPALHYGKGFPWRLATMVGLACGAFAFLLVRAVQNLKAWRPRP